MAIDRITKPLFAGIVAMTWQLVSPLEALYSWNEDGSASATWSCFPSVTPAFCVPLLFWIVTRLPTADAILGPTIHPNASTATMTNAILRFPIPPLPSHMLRRRSPQPLQALGYTRSGSGASRVPARSTGFGLRHELEELRGHLGIAGRPPPADGQVVAVDDVADALPRGDEHVHRRRVPRVRREAGQEQRRRVRLPRLRGDPLDEGPIFAGVALETLRLGLGHVSEPGR